MFGPLGIFTLMSNIYFNDYALGKRGFFLSVEGSTALIRVFSVPLPSRGTNQRRSGQHSGPRTKGDRQPCSARPPSVEIRRPVPLLPAEGRRTMRPGQIHRAVAAPGCGGSVMAARTPQGQKHGFTRRGPHRPRAHSGVCSPRAGQEGPKTASTLGPDAGHR